MVTSLQNSGLLAPQVKVQPIVTSSNLQPNLQNIHSLPQVADLTHTVVHSVIPLKESTGEGIAVKSNEHSSVNFQQITAAVASPVKGLTLFILYWQGVKYLLKYWTITFSPI